MRRVFAIALHICLTVAICVQTSAQDHDVYTIGNFCDVNDIYPLAKSLLDEIQLRNVENTILLTGDLTSNPVTTIEGKQELEKLLLFIDEFKKSINTRIIIMTGDRDWNDSKPSGYTSLLNLESAIESHMESFPIEIHLISDKGCPGPYEIPLNKYTTLLAVNSQWWNHKFQKPTPADALCKYITNPDIAEEVRGIVENNINKNILIASHHPIRSMGNYGGRFSFLDDMKPAPIIGSFINAFKANIGDKYSINNPRLSVFTFLMYNEIYFKSNIVYVSGHEKNHQVHREIENMLVSSGAPIKGGFAPWDFSTLLHENEAGYMRISYRTSGSVNSTFIKLTDGENLDIELFSSACDPDSLYSKVSSNQSYIPCSMSDDINDQNITGSTVKVLPGVGYEASWIKTFLLGVHHRPTWSTNITAPYLRITENYQDLNPYESGGGRQTLSLKFKNEDGKRYTFRSVDKEPRKALDYTLRQSIIGRLFEDQTSAQHPFGAIPVAAMLDRLDILHATPKLYVLPDTEALGPFREQYGGMLGMLEENPGNKDDKGDYFEDADDVVKSNKLFRKLYENKKNKINKEEFIRARLFDILVGDWRKHEDNWKWAMYKKKKVYTFRPIPSNRDHAFSKWDGFIPWLADREWALPNVEGFSFKIDGFQSLVYQARHLDRFLSTEADLNVYLEQAQFIQQELTDEIIESSVKKMPKESFEIEGDLIIEKLKQRRDDLGKYALKFFKNLNDDVEIVGCGKGDYFNIYDKNDSLIVEIWNIPKGQQRGERLFQRRFHEDHTDRVRIYGLGGSDLFYVKLEKESDIELVLLGGERLDEYDLLGQRDNITVVDSVGEIPSSAHGIAVEDNWHRRRYIYNRTSTEYDNYLPFALVRANGFFGTTLQLSNTWTRHRWDKPDYHMRHRISANATSKGDYGFRYDGISRHALGKFDYIWNVDFANPDFFDSYYGQGNFTTIDETLDLQDFYVTTYNKYGGQFGIRRRFWSQSTFSITTGFDHFLNKELENTILKDNTSLKGANEALSIVPIVMNFDLDLRDNQIFPRKGSRLVIDAYNGFIINNDKEQFAKVGISIEQYMSTHNLRPLTLGIKIGGSKGIGDVPFYLQPRLGGNNLLRGYTSNRFFGRSTLFLNSELRWQIFSDQEASVPFKFGISGFFDAGRVSLTIDESGNKNPFHFGYGGGIFLVPFSENLTLSLYFAWSEENSFYPQFTVGSALN